MRSSRFRCRNSRRCLFRTRIKYWAVISCSFNRCSSNFTSSSRELPRQRQVLLRLQIWPCRNNLGHKRESNSEQSVKCNKLNPWASCQSVCHTSNFRSRLLWPIEPPWPRRLSCSRTTEELSSCRNCICRDRLLWFRRWMCRVNSSSNKNSSCNKGRLQLFRRPRSHWAIWTRDC